MFYKFIEFCMMVWEHIYSSLRVSSALIVRIMDFTISPNKRDGKILLWRLILWLIINSLYIMLVIDFHSTSTNAIIKLLLSAFLFVFHILIVIAKMIMITEDNLVMEGILHKDKAQFRKFQTSISNKTIYISAIFIFISLIFATYWFDKIFYAQIMDKNSELIDYAIFIINQLLVPIYQYSVDVGNVFANHQTLVSAMMRFILHSIFVALIYSYIILSVKQARSIRVLVQALASDDSDVQYIQQRAVRYPDFIKKELIDLSINHPNPIVRRRAISIMPHAKVVSFPNVYIYNLHKEKDLGIKEWGMKKVLEILADSEIIYSEISKKEIFRSIQYQRKRQHSKGVLELLDQCKNMISDRITKKL